MKKKRLLKFNKNLKKFLGENNSKNSLYISRSIGLLIDYYFHKDDYRAALDHIPRVLDFAIEHNDTLRIINYRILSALCATRLDSLSLAKYQLSRIVD